MTTDRLDYQPGETAVIAGGGFEPNELLQVQVSHADAHGSNSGNGHESFAVTADAEGNFSTQWFVDPDDSLGSLFLLTVDGSNGRHAEMMFTDTATTHVVNLKTVFVPEYQLAIPAAGSWNTSSGRFSPLNDNYATGAAFGDIYRSFFGFDLPSISGTIESVTLRVANPQPSGSEGAAVTWRVFDVTSSLTDLTSFQVPRPDLWSDLGSGVLYASVVPDPSFTPLSVVFNADGIAAVQAAVGQEFLIGSDYGGFTSYVGNDYIFGRSGGSVTGVQLIITTADNQNQPPVAKCKNVTVSAGANCSAAASVDDGSFDPDAGDIITPTQSPAGPYPIGSTTVTLTVTDSHGLQSSCTAVVTVVDTIEPIVALNGDSTVTVQCHTSFNDPGAVATDDCSGSLPVAIEGALDVNALGLYTLTYSAVDRADNRGTITRQVIVVDRIQPVVTLNGDATVTVACHTAFDDLGATALDTCAGELPVSVSGSVDLNTPGSYTLSYSATDPSGNTGIATRTVIVANTAPTISGISGPVGPLSYSTPVNITVDFADADLSQAHDIVITWNDGTEDTITAPGGVTSATGSHTYAGAGVYEIGVRVTDSCGSTASSTYQFIVSNDASAGSVTGGGWIVAPKGAYSLNPSLTGKATFGFVSKYLKGNTTPSGNTQFNFHAAGLDFKGTAFDWLVISGGRAQFKGSGKINGAGDYAFMITAVDGKVLGSGEVDRFRIKITNKATGATIFDNQTGASPTADLSGEGTKLQGGSISIKK